MWRLNCNPSWDKTCVRFLLHMRIHLRFLDPLQHGLISIWKPAKLSLANIMKPPIHSRRLFQFHFEPIQKPVIRQYQVPVQDALFISLIGPYPEISKIRTGFIPNAFPFGRILGASSNRDGVVAGCMGIPFLLQDRTVRYGTTVWR